MTFEELKEINHGKPHNALIYKALMEAEGIIIFYKEQLAKDKRPYWKGKIGYQHKQIKLLKMKLS